MKMMMMMMMMKQWIKTKKTEIIEGLSNNIDELIDQSKLFEDQIESLKKLEDLKEYWFMKDFDDIQLKFKTFKLKLENVK